jgi:hypothetical protein
LGGSGIAGSFHSLSTVSIPGRRLAAQRQTAETEDHQQCKSYDFLYEHLSPFRGGKKILVPRGFAQKALQTVRVSGRLTIAQQFTAGLKSEGNIVREADG